MTRIMNESVSIKVSEGCLAKLSESIPEFAPCEPTRIDSDAALEMTVVDQVDARLDLSLALKQFFVDGTLEVEGFEAVLASDWCYALGATDKSSDVLRNLRVATAAFRAQR